MKKPKMKTAQILLFFIALLCPFLVTAQKERKEVRKGNEAYEKGKYEEAETNYRKALEKNQSSFPGTYNLGSALYRQKKYDEAVQQYQQAMEKSATDEEKSNAYHN